MAIATLNEVDVSIHSPNFEGNVEDPGLRIHQSSTLATKISG